MGFPFPRLIRRFATALLLAIASITAPAAAGTLQIDPISVEISKNRKVGSVKVTNEESDPVTIHAYALAWSQVDGEDRYEDTAKLILSPPVFTIPGGGTQTVRVGLRSADGAGRPYRLIIEEVPQASSEGGVQVTLRLNLPVFAMMDAGKQSDLRWSAFKAKDGWVLEAANGGSGWVRVDPTAATAATGLVADGSNMGVVLPGSRRQWKLGTAPKVADRGKFQIIVRSSGDDPQTARR
jgi:fimbrial chaperone protein